MAIARECNTGHIDAIPLTVRSAGRQAHHVRSAREKVAHVLQAGVGQSPDRGQPLEGPCAGVESEAEADSDQDGDCLEAMSARSAMRPVTTERDNRRMTMGAPARSPVHNAAHWRKRLQRELRRIGANNVGLYVDGPRGLVRLRFPGHAGQFVLSANDALAQLRSLADGAGVEQAINTIAPTSREQSREPHGDRLSSAGTPR